MPRKELPVPRKTYPAAIVASGEQIDPKKVRRRSKKAAKTENWQDYVTRFYDTIPEYRYCVDWPGAVISKGRLYVEKDGVEVKEGPVAEALDRLYGSKEKQREMLRLLGVMLTGPGDCYIVGRDRGENHPSDWMLLDPSSYRKAMEVGATGTIVEDDDFVCRIWNPHPFDPKSVNSPSRAVLPILGELDMLQKHVSAQGTSRITNAGLLFIPSEADIPTPTGVGDISGMSPASRIMAMLSELADDRITAPEDPTNLFPIVISVSGDQINNVKYEKFWTEFDAQAPALRSEAIRRIALGMDMPPEILLGTADVNHWGAAQISEEAIKSHIEPLLIRICDSLTEGYLWPAVTADDDDDETGLSEEDARQYRIAVDDTEIRLRPNRSRESLELFDRFLLSDEAVLRENGFDPEHDKPTAEQIKVAILQRITREGQTMPEVVQRAAEILGVNFGPITVEGTVVEGGRARPDATLRKHPADLTVPDTDSAAARVLTFRALERAGNRIKTLFKLKLPANIPVHDYYLHHKVEATDLAKIMEEQEWAVLRGVEFALNADKVRSVVNDYASELVLTQGEYSHEELRRRLGAI